MGNKKDSKREIEEIVKKNDLSAEELFEILQELEIDLEQELEILHDQFFLKLVKLAEAAYEAALIFIRIKERFPDRLEIIRKRISREFECDLILVAEKKMLPDFLLDDSYEVKILRKFNIEEQKLYYLDDEPIKVYNPVRDSNNMLNVAQMSRDQLNMVFDDKIGSIRDLIDQKLWCSQEEHRKSVKASKSWSACIKNGKAGARINNQFYTVEEIHDIHQAAVNQEVPKNPKNQSNRL